MMFLSGAVALLQIFYLPGAVFAGRQSVRVTALSFCLAIAPLSLLFNYAFALILTLCHLNHPPEWWGLVVLEGILLYAFRKRERTALFRTESFQFSALERALCGLAVLAGLFFLTRWVKSWGTVIHWTDTALSWNRWALEWTNSNLPTISRFYPQMVAVVLSIPYQFTGQTGVEFFSLSAVTGIPLLAIGALVFSFRSYPEKRVTFSIACMGFIYLLSRISIPLSGYADAPLASVVMILLVLLSLHDSRKEASEGRLIILIALVAGLAAITKQLGVLMVGMVPTVVLVREGKPWNREKALKAFVIAAGIATSWYGIKVYDFFTGSDMFGLPGIVSTVQLGIFERIPPALRDLDGYLIPDSIPGVVRVGFYLAVALLITYGALRDALARWLLAFSVAVAVFWVFVASYDSRNLSLAVPFMALLLGRSVAARVKTVTIPGKYAGVNFKPVYVWTLIALSAGVGQFLLPDEVLKREQKFWHEEWIKNGASFLSPDEIPKP